MKQLHFSFFFLLFAAFTAEAQVSVGPGLAYGFDIEELGIQARGQYSFNETWRGEADFIFHHFLVIVLEVRRIHPKRFEDMIIGKFSDRYERAGHNIFHSIVHLLFIKIQHSLQRLLVWNLDYFLFLHLPF